MTEKRPTPRTKNGDQPKKKRRLQDARSIPIQSAVRQQDQGCTEESLNLETFVESRKFEMESFVTSMNTSRHKASQRAFQTVPRELRRRTASHNAKRVPKRLQQRAFSEMTESSSSGPKTHRRKLAFRLRYRKAIATIAKRSKPMEIVDSQVAVKKVGIKREEKRKSWMPTHLWCAKRSHMVFKWGSSITYTPTAKCWKSTYRSSELHGSVIWDMSYTATFTLEGPQVDLKKVLSLICAAQDASFTRKRVVAGLEGVATWFFKIKKWPFDPIAPVSIFWCDSKLENHLFTKRNSPVSPGTRTIIIRVHPSVSKNVWDELLEAVKYHGAAKCILSDRRRDIGSIQLTGPSTPSILHKILHSKGLSDPDNVRTEYEFTTSRKLLNAYIIDEKISTIDVKKKAAKDTKVGLEAPVSSHPSTAERGRMHLCEETNVCTGIPSNEKVIPITAISSTLGLKSQTGGPYRNLHNTLCNTWILMMPWVHVLTVWKMLIHIPGVRFGGLRELEEISLMRGEPLFPEDFDFTNHFQSKKIKPLSSPSKNVGITTDQSGPGSSIIPPEMVSIFIHSSLASLSCTINNHFFVVALDYALGGIPSTGSVIYSILCPDEVRSKKQDRSIHANNPLQHKCLPKNKPDEIAGYVVRSCLNMKTGRGCGFGWLQWHAAVTTMKKSGVRLSGWCGVNVGDSGKEARMVMARWIAV